MDDDPTVDAGQWFGALMTALAFLVVVGLWCWSQQVTP